MTGRAQAQEAKLGAQLIGKLEGPELVLDPAKWPKKFAEAPMLADLVKQGKLPPVDQRVPDEPMVVKPLHEIGSYGGTWRRGFTGPGRRRERQPHRVDRQDPLLGLHRDQDHALRRAGVEAERRRQVGDDLAPQGQKWSDGAPFTADDFVFWFEEVYLNKDLVPTPHRGLHGRGQAGSLRKIDDTTVEFEFDEPYFLFVDILAGATAIGGGQATAVAWTSSAWAPTSPAHYLKQFLPKYSSKDEVDAQGQGGRLRQLGQSYFKKGLARSTPSCRCWPRGRR